MKLKTAALLLGAAWAIGAAFPATSRAAVILYGATRTGGLYTLNTTTAAPTFVGNLPVQTTEIEYDGISNRAWAQLPDGNFQIQEFNINTGAGIGGTINDLAAFNGLEFVGPTLFGTAITGPGGPSNLRTLNPSTGASVVVGNTGVGPLAGLAFDGPTGTMFAIAGGPAPANLYRINLATGLATLVGSTGIQAGSLEIGPDGQLYAGGTGTAVEGFLYRINKTTGASTLVGDTGLIDLTGLTLVPEPGSLALVGLALARLAFVRRR
jgi:hypothetical protein